MSGLEWQLSCLEAQQVMDVSARMATFVSGGPISLGCLGYNGNFRVWRPHKLGMSGLEWQLSCLEAQQVVDVSARMATFVSGGPKSYGCLG